MRMTFKPTCPKCKSLKFRGPKSNSKVGNVICADCGYALKDEDLREQAAGPVEELKKLLQDRLGKALK